jgi:hypothetical protein
MHSNTNFPMQNITQEMRQLARTKLQNCQRFGISLKAVFPASAQRLIFIPGSFPSLEFVQLFQSRVEDTIAAWGRFLLLLGSFVWVHAWQGKNVPRSSIPIANCKLHRDLRR